MISPEVKELINETKISLLEYLPKLINACDQITEEIQLNKNSWVKLIDDMTDGISWVYSAITGINKINSLFSDIEIDELNMLLKEIESALERQDYIELADLFSYELKPYLENTLDSVKLAMNENV